VCFKCNVDGAFSENDHTGATGVVIRDHDGQFKAGRAVWHNEAHDALLMEAMACRDGIEMAQQLGVSKLCLETDCLQLINLWNILHTEPSFSSQNRGEKHCIRIPVAFRLYLVKIIQILAN
jgi:ribonuclease HI